jgi:SAM-dependent methyltransferase
VNTSAPSTLTTLVDHQLLAGRDQDTVVLAAHRLYEHLLGLWAPGVIEAAFDLGVFVALADGVPVTSAHLAEKLNSDPRGMRVLLDALAAYEMLERSTTNGTVHYGLNAELADCLLPDGLFSLAGKMRYDRMMAWDAWRNLGQAVRGEGSSGHSENHHNGISEVEYESLVRGINFWAPPIISILAGALREQGWGGEQSAAMLDVGCGTGLYSQLLMKEFPKLTGVGLDVARIVKIAQAQGERMGVQDRFQPVEKDFWIEDWGGGYDLILFANIYHLQNPESAADLSIRASKALSEDGIVAIIDQIVDDRTDTASTQDRFFRLFAASMLATGGGDSYQLSEYDEWLSNASLRRVALIDTPMHRILLAKHA